MQNQSSDKIIINNMAINAVLDTSASTGLVGLLKNAHLLEMLNQNSHVQFPHNVHGFMQSNIEITAQTIGRTLNALSFSVMNDPENEHITPDVLADFGVVASELLSYLVALSVSLNTLPPTLPVSQSPQS